MIKFTGRKRFKLVKPLFSEPLMVLQLEKVETNRTHVYNECGRVEIDDLPDLTYWESAILEDVTCYICIAI